MINNDIKFCKIKNNSSISLNSIPVLPYSEFCDFVVELLCLEENHCVNYFAYKFENGYNFIIAIANDLNSDIYVFSHQIENGEELKLKSLTPQIIALHIFEREIFESYGIDFEGHQWLKPVRYPFDRADKKQVINNYPFYQIKSYELHEVGVGPIHAGVIEPGHFRFICNGEDVLHLEIQLGWQHRGIEKLMLQKNNLLQRTILSESIAGDTAVAHSLAFAQLIETLASIEVSDQLKIERSLALELERIAVHTADIAALCTDVAYNLGANIFGILRTGIINYTQLWCGCRLGKSMIRVGGINLPFTKELSENLLKVIKKYEFQFNELAHHTYKMASIENRFDYIGTVSKSQMWQIGAVGMAARMANLKRDIRWSHKFAGFEKYPMEPVFLPNGDVFARFLLRRKEIKSSIAWIKNMLSFEKFENPSEKPVKNVKMKTNSFAISLTEGWRGEICHCAITDSEGEIIFYKIKDPSLHNWKALELSLRNLEISDFPINNKGYNLSYCGFDL